MRTFLAQVAGSWLAFMVLGVFVRVFGAKSTGITCGWCGTKVPMVVAVKDGIGGANAAMRAHMLACELHPMHVMRLDLEEQKRQMKRILKIVTEAPTTIQDPLAWHKETVRNVREIARAMAA